MVLLLDMGEQYRLKLARKQKQREKENARSKKIFKHAGQTNHSPFREKILKMDHLHHDSHILLCSRAQVVFDVTLSLELENHLLNGHTLSADAAELVP